MCTYRYTANQYEEEREFKDYQIATLDWLVKKRITNNPKNPYTIGTDYRAIAQKRPTAQGFFFGVYLKE